MTAVCVSSAEGARFGVSSGYMRALTAPGGRGCGVSGRAYGLASSDRRRLPVLQSGEEKGEGKGITVGRILCRESVSLELRLVTGVILGGEYISCLNEMQQITTCRPHWYLLRRASTVNSPNNSLLAASWHHCMNFHQYNSLTFLHFGSNGRRPEACSR